MNDYSGLEYLKQQAIREPGLIFPISPLSMVLLVEKFQKMAEMYEYERRLVSAYDRVINGHRLCVCCCDSCSELKDILKEGMK